MSSFSADWEACMGTHGMPVPHMEDAAAAFEFLEHLHSAFENSGGEIDGVVTIGSLIASGSLAGVGEGALVVLAGVAQTAAAVYVSQGISCVFAVAALDVKRLFSSNELPGFVADELSEQGVDLQGQANV